MFKHQITYLIFHFFHNPMLPIPRHAVNIPVAFLPAETGSLPAFTPALAYWCLPCVAVRRFFELNKLI
jgi:hypothetical protein